MAKVLLKALDILALFDGERPEWAEHEIARELALPTSTAHRILRTLEYRGYVGRTHAGRYRLGSAAVDLGRRATEHGLTASIRAALEGLAAETEGGLVIFDRMESADEAAVAALTRAVGEAE